MAHHLSPEAQQVLNLIEKITPDDATRLTCHDGEFAHRSGL